MAYKVGEVYSNYGMEDGRPIEWEYTFVQKSNGEVGIKVLSVKECEKVCTVQ